MVTLTEVEDEHFQEYAGAPFDDDDDDDYSDTDSEISNDSDFDAETETLAERLYALRDIVPPKTRGWIADSVSSASGRAWSVLSVGGRGAWVVAASAIFFTVPFAITYFDDQQYATMEQEYNMRQSGGDMLTAGVDEQGTADAALDETSAKPAL